MIIVYNNPLEVGVPYFQTNPSNYRRPTERKEVDPYQPKNVTGMEPSKIQVASNSKHIRIRLL
jgi:hypothetical protein